MKKYFILLLAVILSLSFTCITYAGNAPADGIYSVGVTLSGSGHNVTASSPTELTVSGGQMSAVIVLSSVNFTWMSVDNGATRYNNTNAGGNSTFSIPVSALDTDVAVVAETLAMSSPQQVHYTLHFDSSTLTLKSGGAAPQQTTAPQSAQPATSPTQVTQQVTEQSTEAVTQEQTEETTEMSTEKGTTDKHTANKTVVVVCIIAALVIAAAVVTLIVKKRKGDKI